MLFHQLQLESWLHLALPFIRALSMLALIPFTISPAPISTRIGLSLFLGYVAGAGLDGSLHAPDLFGLLWLIAGEVCVGLALGFAVAIVYQAAKAAGSIVSQEMALMQSNIFNPATNQQESIITVPLSYVVTIMIFATGAHQFIVLAFIRSFAVSPPGIGIPTEASVSFMAEQVAQIFVIGAQIAAPFIAANFIVVFAFSILGRAVPSINVFMLSFSVRILVGFILLAATSALMVRYLMHPVESTPERMLRSLPTALAVPIH